VGVAEAGRLPQRLTDVLDDPGLVVLLLDPSGQLDGRHRLPHPLAVVVLEGLLVHHLEGIDLAQVQVGIDEGFRHQVALRVDLFLRPPLDPLLDRGDPAVGDADVEQAAGATA